MQGQGACMCKLPQQDCTHGTYTCKHKNSAKITTFNYNGMSLEELVQLNYESHIWKHGNVHPHNTELILIHSNANQN